MVGLVEGISLGASDVGESVHVGASVLSQQPKNMMAPVCGDTPGQHWPESCISRHLSWALQSPAVVGDRVGVCDGLELGDAVGDIDGRALGVMDGDVVGDPLGFPLGLGDGESVGDALGNVLGAADGIAEGRSDVAELRTAAFDRTVTTARSGCPNATSALVIAAGLNASTRNFVAASLSFKLLASSTGAALTTRAADVPTAKMISVVTSSAMRRRFIASPPASLPASSA